MFLPDVARTVVAAARDSSRRSSIKYGSTQKRYGIPVSAKRGARTFATHFCVPHASRQSRLLCPARSDFRTLSPLTCTKRLQTHGQAPLRLPARQTRVFAPRLPADVKGG